MWLYDQDGNNTFFGYSSFTASSRATNKPIYNVSMQNFPLFTNVSSAQVLALDSDGRTATPYEVMVNSKGHVLLQGWMMGSLNGLLSVRYKDGSVTNYNLWSTNSSSPPVIVESGESAKFEGHTIAELNSTNGATLNIMEVWNLPTVYIKVPVGQSVMLNVLGLAYDQNGQYFERPYGMTVRYDNGSEVELPLDPTQAVSTFFPAGNYRLRFKWKEFLKPGTIYTGPGSGTKG
jgi:hypothetical protein